MIDLSKKIKSLKGMEEGRENLEINFKKFSKELSTLSKLRNVYSKKIENPYDLVDIA